MTDMPPQRFRWGFLVRHGATLVLLLLVVPFSLYAAGFGWRALTGDLGGESYLFAGRAPLAETGLSLHMIAGAAITLVVPVQVLPSIRHRVPALHRWTGRIIIAASLVASGGGLLFILRKGTIGGTIMDAGFALYGALLGLAALLAIAAARRGDFALHRRWALRLAVLILGSWLFRVHYGLWYAATGGVGSNEALTGLFDRIQVFAFYLPYLGILELYLRRAQSRVRASAGIS